MTYAMNGVQLIERLTLRESNPDQDVFAFTSAEAQ